MPRTSVWGIGAFGVVSRLKIDCVAMSDKSNSLPALKGGSSLPRSFSRYRDAISSALRAELSGLELGIYGTHRYYMGWENEDGDEISLAEGKRLRPTLALVGCEALGRESELALPVAVALEYIHNFSLIHDDLEDRDRFRHHRPTVWVVWGDAVGVISGNAMLKIADRVARGLMDMEVEPETVFRVERSIVDSYLRMMEGQFLDLDYESRVDISIGEYLEMIERKTGALIEGALYSGAMVAVQDDGDEAVAEGLRRVGFELGRLFQIRDDVLGVWGSERTGKPVGSDLRRRKKALPAVHALNFARGASKRRIDEIFAVRDDEVSDAEVADLLQIMDDVETYRYCEWMARSHGEAVAAMVDEMDLSEGVREDLLELGRYLLERDS